MGKDRSYSLTNSLVNSDARSRWLEPHFPSELMDRNTPRRGHVYALFADIMGFARTLEGLTDAEHDDLDAMLWSPANGPGLAPSAVWIASSYELFHKKVRELSWEFHLFIDSMITFADSMYAVSPEFHVVRFMATSLMTHCYHWNIPLRAGIGYGNFARLAFSTLSRPSGALIADSPFLGNAIVRAYRAQERPAQGFRIFLHPSVTATEGPSWGILDLPEDQCSGARNRELNFLHRLWARCDCRSFGKSSLGNLAGFAPCPARR